MIIAVTDACIFIDCHKLGCLDDLFALPYTIHTTYAVYLECETFLAQLDLHAVAGQLVITTSDESMPASFESASKGLSISDLTVPAYALDLPEAMVLTSDARLRKFCRTLKIETHGSLWIFEQLVLCAHWDFPKAIHVAEKLALRNRRAPQSEIKKCCKAWRQGNYLLH